MATELGELPEGFALSMVLTDMGNGVTRISGVRFVVAPLRCPPGWSALVLPLSPRVRDAIIVSRGLAPSLRFAGLPCGWCRYVNASDTGYLVSHFG